MADFGLSKTVATDGVSAITSKPGTAVFAAPELLRAGSLAAESDVYSFGVVAWHLISMGSGLADMEDVQVHYQVLFSFSSFIALLCISSLGWGRMQGSL